jgi:hypothetical protein
MQEGNGKEEKFEDYFGDIDFENDEPLSPEKEKEIHTKQVIFNVYDNLRNKKEGKNVDEFKSLPEEKEVNEALNLASKKTDVLKALKEYPDLIKKAKKGDEEAALALEMDVFYSQVDKINEAMKELSKKLGKDVVKDMVERDEIEKKVTGMIQEFTSLTNRRLNYKKLSDEIIRTSVLDAAKKTNLNDEDKKLLGDLKKEIDWLIKEELEDIKNKKWEYSDEKIAAETKKKLEELSKARYQELFDLKNLTHLGLLLERREGSFVKLEQEVEDLNEKASDYHPVKF